MEEIKMETSTDLSVVEGDIIPSSTKEIDEEFNEEEFNKNLEEMDKTIKEIETPNITNVLKEFRFKNKMDEEIFNRLPLTNIQKEYLLLSVNTDLLPDEVPAEHGYIETEKIEEADEEDIGIEVKK